MERHVRGNHWPVVNHPFLLCPSTIEPVSVLTVGIFRYGRNIEGSEGYEMIMDMVAGMKAPMAARVRGEGMLNVRRFVSNLSLS